MKFHFPFGANILDGELTQPLPNPQDGGREKKTSQQILLLYYFQNPLFAQRSTNQNEVHNM